MCKHSDGFCLRFTKYIGHTIPKAPGVRSRVMSCARSPMPASRLWLLARRLLSGPKEIAYYLCLAPPEVSLKPLAEVAGARFTIEQCFEEAKCEAGLDQ